MTTPGNPRPGILCILDGWGLRDEPADNAIAQAETPNYDRLMASAPNASIDTDGVHVGLPEGQMGNSEVGHMNLGGGRVVLQDLPQINQAIEDGTLAEIATLRDFITKLKATGGACHLMGLLSPGGVHAHQDHIAALATILDTAGIAVHIHAILDGRDTPPSSAGGFVDDFLGQISGCRNAHIATVSGRFYAMDRDQRWERVTRAWQAMALAEGTNAATAPEAIKAAYAAGESDEFISPAVIGAYAGMADGDGLLMANFRADRAREILAALLMAEFDGFERPRVPAFAAAAGMVEYSTDLNPYITALFPPQELHNTLGEVVAGLGLKQLRIAETEKYAHVTFFFNGGREAPFEGEDRILIPSPKVRTYDLQPEMSAAELTDRLVEAIESGTYDLIVVNYANPDMVGHTGNLGAAIIAVETVDKCLGRLTQAVGDAGGVMLVTADHGNVEMMTNHQTGQPHTAHTTCRVPLIMVAAEQPENPISLRPGRLADVAPTLLRLIGLDIPVEMTGQDLTGPAHDGRKSVAAE